MGVGGRGERAGEVAKGTTQRQKEKGSARRRFGDESKEEEDGRMKTHVHR